MVLDVIRALGRRWYVVVIGLLLTGGLVFGAYKASPPEYNARALVLLLPPRADVGKGGNPFLLLSGLEQPAGILAAYFSSAPARSDVEAISPTAEYEVGIDDSTRGPVIAIDVTDESPVDTLRVLAYLLDEIPAELARLQQQVDTRGDAIVGSMSLTVDREAEPDLRGTVRLMIAALVVGVVGTGFAAVALDGFLQRRRQRAEGPPSEDEAMTREEADTSVPPQHLVSRPTVISTAAVRPEPDVQIPIEADLPPAEPTSDESPSRQGESSPQTTSDAGVAVPSDADSDDVTAGTSAEVDEEVDEETNVSRSSSWSW